MDCHQTFIGNNYIHARPFKTLTGDSAGIYFCTHWFNPGTVCPALMSLLSTKYFSTEHMFHDSTAWKVDHVSFASATTADVLHIAESTIFFVVPHFSERTV